MPTWGLLNTFWDKGCKLSDLCFSLHLRGFLLCIFAGFVMQLPPGDLCCQSLLLAAKGGKPLDGSCFRLVGLIYSVCQLRPYERMGVRDDGC